MVLDCETTGLLLHPAAELHKQPQVIEFACSLLSRETGEVVESRSMLINPGRPLPPEIVKITGLTDADLEGQPFFQERLAEIEELFRRSTVMLAHNLPFDEGMLLNELRRVGCKEFPWPRGLCSIGLYAQEWGRNMRMVELYQALLGKPLEQTHRAADDVAALVEIVQVAELWRL